ncbi:hypothetical protein KEM60_00732 [Austwickia sp. TVS 96-490-7B]|uniref:hypothetical protein n=1 Tax=Austwickia sp. TVS 96-490-7B TaxID=2830843 RepID=UPI001C589C3A|nr:hypothetical protein [Austwickia sp. TVS 96-490-7B]MBW3084544.1 hypothetical protein [Austwickia sp. TVS 96-490-7B]
MRAMWRPAATSVTRAFSAFIAPILVYALATAGMIALTALVSASIAGGGNTGALTIFLVTTAVGLLAIACSVIDVVRAGFEADLAALAALGCSPVSIRMFTATQSLSAFGLSLPLGTAAAAPVYGVLLWLLRTGKFHGLPHDSPDWVSSFLIGIAVTAVLALIGGWRARPLRTDRRTGSRRVMAHAPRIAAGAAAVVGAVALLMNAGTSGLGALFGSALVWVLAAVLLAPALFTLLCLAPGLAHAWPVGWSARVALTRDRLFGLSSSVTVATLALILFTALVSMVGTVERVQRAALADLFTPTAAVVTSHDGALLPREFATRICRTAPSCIGLVHIAPDTSDQHGTAYSDSRTRQALLTDTADAEATHSGQVIWTSPENGFTGSPWQRLRDGAAPEISGTWRALPVLTTPATITDPTVQVIRARSWAAEGPSQAVLRGSGAADIAPMLAPLITLSLLFSAAAVYLLNASFYRTTRVTTALGATTAGDLLTVFWDALARTLTVYLLTLITWWGMAHGVARVATHHAVTPTSPPVLLHLAFLALLVITTAGGVLGTRAGRRLA